MEGFVKGWIVNDRLVDSKTSALVSIRLIVALAGTTPNGQPSSQSCCITIEAASSTINFLFVVKRIPVIYLAALFSVLAT